MATHSSVLAWRIPGTGEPRGLPSMGSHRIRHDWSDLAAAAAAAVLINIIKDFEIKNWRHFFCKIISGESETQIDCMIWFLGKQKMNRNVFEKKYFVNSGSFGSWDSFSLIFTYFFYQYAFIIIRIKYDWSINIFLQIKILIISVFVMMFVKKLFVIMVCWAVLIFFSSFLSKIS